MNRRRWLSIKLILFIIILIIVGMISTNFISLKTQKLTDGEEKVFSDIEKIVVESVSLPVTIYEADVKKVKIIDNSKIYGLSNKKTTTIEQEDEVVFVKQGRRMTFFSFVTGEIIIEVPRGSLLEYDINSISGEINHNALSKETLNARSISGAVEVQQGGEQVLIETTSGAVRIHAPFQEVSANSVSGSIRIVANQNTKKIVTSTISGSTSIQLENVSGYDMDYSTISGSIKDAYEGLNYSNTGSLIIGDSLLKINSSSTSGSIKLEDWKK